MAGAAGGITKRESASNSTKTTTDTPYRLLYRDTKMERPSIPRGSDGRTRTYDTFCAKV